MRTTPGGWGLVYSRMMEQTHAHMDSKKGAFNIDIDQQLSDPVSRKDFPPYTFPTSLPLLGLPSDVIGIGPDVGGGFPYPPSHSWAPCTGHEGWDIWSNTPAKHLHSSQLWLTLNGPVPSAAVKVRCHQSVRWEVGRPQIINYSYHVIIVYSSIPIKQHMHFFTFTYWFCSFPQCQ